MYQSGEPVVQERAVHCREGGPADGRDGIRALQRGDVPQRNGPERPPGGGNGLHHRLDLGPLPPLDRRAGPEPVRMERRFWFGIGSGENLNEHILGDHWPPTDVRLEMMEEAVQVIRLLWEGTNKRYYGKHYTGDTARLYTLPDEPPPIYVSAFGPKAIEVAARIGDGYVGTAPEGDLLNDFIEKAGEDKPRLGEMKVCWNEDESEARRMVHRLWPNIGLPGELSQELATPRHFEQAASLVTEEMVADTPPTGPDPQPYLESIRQYEEAGYTEIYMHQIGPDQEGFFRFFGKEILPEPR